MARCSHVHARVPDRQDVRLLIGLNLVTDQAIERVVNLLVIRQRNVVHHNVRHVMRLALGRVRIERLLRAQMRRVVRHTVMRIPALHPLPKVPVRHHSDISLVKDARGRLVHHAVERATGPNVVGHRDVGFALVAREVLVRARAVLGEKARAR